MTLVGSHGSWCVVLIVCPANENGQLVRHHYIPRFLLRAWTGYDGCLEYIRIDKEELWSRRRTPKSVAFEEDLYVMDVPSTGETDPQSVETEFLKRVDDRAAKARRKLMSRKTLTPEEGKEWIVFLMSLRVRYPGAVSFLRREGAKVAQELDEDPWDYMALAGPGDPLTPSGWIRHNAPGYIENIGISQVQALATDQTVLEKIRTVGHHSVVNFQSCREHLLLADNACIFVYGVDHEEFTLALPLSPRMAFVSSRSDKVMSTLQGVPLPSLLTKMNQWSVQQARSQLYAMDRSLHSSIRRRLRTLRSAEDRPPGHIQKPPAGAP